MYAAADDTQELAVDVGRHREALVGSEDADAMNLTGLHDDGVVVWVAVCFVADVAVMRRALVHDIPQRTTAVDVVREQYFQVTVEPHVGRRSPATSTPAELTLGPESGLGVERTAEFGTSSSVRCALEDERLVNSEVADGAPLEVGRPDDAVVRGVLIRNGVRLALDEGHHQATEPRILGELYGSNLCHGLS